MGENSVSTCGKAKIQVYAKGFRVSERSEEFQLVIPSDPGHLDALENQLLTVEWGTILQPLYRLTPSLLLREFAVLLAADGCVIVSAAQSEDSHGRKSIVAVAAAFSLDWTQSPELMSEGMSRARSLVRRLAEAYGRSMANSPVHVHEQLRSDRFLPDRAFDLGLEEPDRSLDWPALLREIHRWKGIRGVATKPLLRMGGNVLYGTRDELERARGETLAVDGLFDVTKTAIVPFGPGLELWHREVDLLPSRPSDFPVAKSDRIEELHVKIDLVIREQARTRGLAERILDLLAGVMRRR